MPGSETKDSLPHSTAGGTSITLVPGPLLAPKSHGGDAEGARWVTHMQCICITAEDPHANLPKPCSRDMLSLPHQTVNRSALLWTGPSSLSQGCSS